MSGVLATRRTSLDRPRRQVDAASALVCIPIPPRESWLFVRTEHEVPDGFMALGRVSVARQRTRRPLLSLDDQRQDITAYVYLQRTADGELVPAVTTDQATAHADERRVGPLTVVRLMFAREDR